MQKEFSVIERKTITRAIENAKQTGDQYRKKGLSPFTFFFGLMNLMLTSFIVGKMPENYWVFMTFKCYLYLCLTWRERILDKTKILFMVEFCWVSCHVLLIFLTSGFLKAVFDIGGVPFTFSKYAFYGFWGLANGPFALAVVWSNYALVLHSMSSLSIAFIHVSPCTLAWALRWYAPQVMEKWPGIFDLPDPEINDQTFL